MTKTPIVLKVSNEGLKNFKEIVQILSNGTKMDDDQFITKLLSITRQFLSFEDAVTIGSIVDETKPKPPTVKVDVKSTDETSRRTNLSYWIEDFFNKAYPEAIRNVDVRKEAKKYFNIAYDKQVPNAIKFLRENGTLKRVGRGTHQAVVSPPPKPKIGSTNKVIKKKKNGFQCPQCGKKSVQVKIVKLGGKEVRAFSCRDCRHNWRENT